MTSFMALDGVTSFSRLKDVTITCKRMRRSLSIGGSSSVQWRKVGRLKMCVRRLLCVRIEIDQLPCVNCWVIIHCLSVSCTKINHSRCALVIWSSLQLTSKQWIITQQFTAGADLFLKQWSIQRCYGYLLVSKTRYTVHWMWRMYIIKIQSNLENSNLDFSKYSLIQNKFGAHKIQRIWSKILFLNYCLP